MNGATTLVQTLKAAGIEVCFCNPGTSEMHFVAALDQVSGIRCILGLFEGVVTGAADGYARMTGKPAVTLLHLGPGLGNGLANLHNARKARTAIVNIVGEHALRHIEHDAPLTADIAGIAAPVSNWVKIATDAQSLAEDAAEAVAAAQQYPGQIATLILPANTAWEPANTAAPPRTIPAPPVVDASRISAVARALHTDEPSAIILGGDCVHEEALEYASRIAQKTNATLLAETSNARFERGAGRVGVTAIPYSVDQAIDMLATFRTLITVNAKAPVAFFAYPDKPSYLYRDDAKLHSLATPFEDGKTALKALCEELNAGDIIPARQTLSVPDMPIDAPLNAENIATLLAIHMPDNAIIVDEAVSTGRNFQAMTTRAQKHDWLQICGGSIGDGFPLATGAAVACPERKVVALQADGSGMYTLQALWTQAREQLDITTIVLANRAYAILKHEMKNVNGQSGKTAKDMMELNRPELNWVSLAAGMGVDAVRVGTVNELHDALQQGLSTRGPFLIEALL
jgi:acetolactate synthase-1/2/3 large subunit